METKLNISYKIWHHQLAAINSNEMHLLVHIIVLTIAENKFSLYHIEAILVLSHYLLYYLNEAVFTVLNVQCALKG